MEADYLRRRLREERERAALAACQQSRLAHEGLADCFARELSQLTGNRRSVRTRPPQSVAHSSVQSGVTKRVGEVVPEEPSAFRFGRCESEQSIDPQALTKRM